MSTETMIRRTTPPPNAAIVGSAHISCEDAMALVKARSNGSVHAIICDPPFPKVEYNRSLGTKTRLKLSKGSNNAWFPDGRFGYERWEEMLREFERSLIIGGHIFIKCDFDLMKELILCLSRMGKTKLNFQFDLPWDKQAMSTGYFFRHQHERWLWIVKGKNRRMPEGMNRSTPDIFRYKRLKDYGKNSPHHGLISPAQMPLAMVADLICQTTDEGEVVMDPFLGRSGATALACVALGRVCYASEVVPAYAEHAKQRAALVAENPAYWRQQIEERQEQHRKGMVPSRIPVLEAA